MDRGRRPRTSSDQNKEGDDFYSQIASLAGDFDSSEAESSGTDLNPNSPAKVDVDSLDTNLFSSLKDTATNRTTSNGSSPSPHKRTAKEAPVEKKPKGLDMGELSKLLGTDDIMKDLSSPKNKPAKISTLMPLHPGKPDTQIKKEADDLLDLLSSTFDDGDFKTGKPKVALSATSSDKSADSTSLGINDNFTVPAKDSHNEGVPDMVDHEEPKAGKLSITPSQPNTETIMADKPLTSDTSGSESAEKANKPSSLKSPLKEKKALKTAATVNFDSDDGDDDFLAGLGFGDDDNNGSTNKTTSKKSVRFSDESISVPSKLPTQELSQEKEKPEPSSENLELPEFPWQKKSQKQKFPVQKTTEANGGHDQAGTEKLEPPQFPWQQKPNGRRQSLTGKYKVQFGDEQSDQPGVHMDNPFNPTKSQSHPELKQEATSIADLMELGDPFAKKVSKRANPKSEEIKGSKVKTNSQPSPVSTDSSALQGLLDFGDPFTKKPAKAGKPKQSTTESKQSTTGSKQSTAESKRSTAESLLTLRDPLAKKHTRQTKTQEENQSPDNALELGDQSDKITKSPRSLQKSLPEDILQFDDPFSIKTRNKPARPHTSSRMSLSLSDPEDSSVGTTATSSRVKNELPEARKRSARQDTLVNGDAGVQLEDQRAIKRAEEVEQALERERLEHTRSKQLLIDAEAKLHLSNSELEKWRLKAEYLQSSMSETEATKQGIHDELMTKLKETTLSLQKTEMEHGHAQNQLESLKKRHEEEIESLKLSFSMRITHLEESVSTTETRWKEELKVEVTRWQEKLQCVEKEKADAVQKLQKEVQGLEVAKTQDIDMLKNMYKSTIENLKNDHETDKQQLARRHLEEVQAIKDAQLHSRTLSELNSKVEASSKMVAQLQAKLAEEHDQVLEERTQRNKAHESQLKRMEERLFQQQMENEAERSRLQGLIAKMESRISQQDRIIEQDRWNLHQEQAKLKAQQTAFREEQLLSRNRLEEDRNQFQLTREKFLTEQQDILSKCYQEQQKVAMEKAEASFRKKQAEDYQMSSKKLSQQAMVERDVSMSHLNEELVRMEVEKKKLAKLETELKVERQLLDAEKEKLHKFTDDIFNRSKEVDVMCKDATEMRRIGEKELLEAQQLQKECQSQQEGLKAELASLRKKEIKISEEQLELLEQRKQFEEQMHRAAMSIETSSEPFKRSQVSIMDLTPIPTINDPVKKLPVIDSRRHVHPPDQQQTLYSSLSVAPSSPPPKHLLSTKLSLPLMQSSVIQYPTPGPTPSTYARQNSSRLASSRSTPEKSTSIQAYLHQLEHNVYARKDYEELEKQEMFLDSLSNSHHMKL